MTDNKHNSCSLNASTIWVFNSAQYSKSPYQCPKAVRADIHLKLRAVKLIQYRRCLLAKIIENVTIIGYALESNLNNEEMIIKHDNYQKFPFLHSSWWSQYAFDYFMSPCYSHFMSPASTPLYIHIFPLKVPPLLPLPIQTYFYSNGTTFMTSIFSPSTN